MHAVARSLRGSELYCSTASDTHLVPEDDTYMEALPRQAPRSVNPIHWYRTFEERAWLTGFDPDFPVRLDRNHRWTCKVVWIHTVYYIKDYY